uniref:Uncharacterized protein n=1 Tax=Romanomermis culicivorax TaxID=13658 RepID=A0A915JVG4_ROMCU
MGLLGPNSARWALKFIANGTITISPIKKFLLDGEPSSPAVDAVCRAVEQASHILLPAVVATPPTAALPVAATWPSETVTIATSPPAKDKATNQIWPAAAQNTSPATTTESSIIEPMAIKETMHPVNEDVSIIEESPFPTETALQSPKVGVLREIYACG